MAYKLNYQDINEILLFISDGMNRILGKNLIGLYLYGSLTYGDFNLGSSDIDLVAIVTKPLNHDETELIKLFHKQVEVHYQKWSDRLECSYTPIDMLKNTLPPEEPRPYYNATIFYENAPYGNEWLINNHLLYEHGIPLIGPEFKELIKPIDMIEVQKACIRDLFQEWEPKITDLKWLDNSHNQSYLVMNLCRILYTVLLGTTGTKTVSAEWVKNIFGLPWSNLIEIAEKWKYGREMFLKYETIDFIKFCIDTIKQTKLYQQMQFSSNFDFSLIEAMKTSHIPGAAILIIHDGNVNISKEYGLADPQNNRPVTHDTLFTIASISKTVTATAMMILYEQGKFNLDDNINIYLPFEIRNPTFPNIPITFRMLLSHTSSIQDSDTLYEHYTLHQTPVLPDSPITLGNYLKNYLSDNGSLYNAEKNFLKEAPGAKYSYTNTGFGLLGYLTECISGIPFEKFCKQTIFYPLDMKNTCWYFKDVDLNLMAIPYGYDDLLHRFIRYDFYSYPTYPDGALKTNVNEFARFLSVFVNAGATFDGKLLLQPETIKEMLTVHHFPGMDPGVSVGFAWHFDGRVYCHDGRDPGISTATYFNPTTRQGMIFFSNGSNFDVLKIPDLTPYFS